jgi:uncharacterized protein YkwD
VHHHPAGPPLTARLHGALTRWLLLTRRALRRRSGRLVLGGLVTAVVTGLVLSVPVVSGFGSGTPTVALDASSSSAARSSSEDSPVVMGRDGRPVTSSTFAGVEAATSSPPADAPAEHSAEATQTETTQDDVVVAAPGTTASAPDTTTGEDGAPAPAAGLSPSAEVPAPAGSGAEPVTPEPSSSAPAGTPETLPGTPVEPAGSAVEDQVLALVNAERAAAGCGPLVADGGLAAVARAHSEDMRDLGYFDHESPAGLDPFERADLAGLTAWAENIAMGQQNATEVMAAWMDSSGHRANILDCDLTLLGVGVAEGSGGPWWTQLFG